MANYDSDQDIMDIYDPFNLDWQIRHPKPRRGNQKQSRPNKRLFGWVNKLKAHLCERFSRLAALRLKIGDHVDKYDDYDADDDDGTYDEDRDDAWSFFSEKLNEVRVRGGYFLDAEELRRRLQVVKNLGTPPGVCLNRMCDAGGRGQSC